MEFIPDICYSYRLYGTWRQICHVETIQIFPHSRCGEIWNLSTSALWRKFRFFYITNVKKSDISPHPSCVWCGECLQIYAILLQNLSQCNVNRVVAKSVSLQTTHFCMEKNSTNNAGKDLLHIQNDSRNGPTQQKSWPGVGGCCLKKSEFMLTFFWLSFCSFFSNFSTNFFLSFVFIFYDRFPIL